MVQMSFVSMIVIAKSGSPNLPMAFVPMIVIAKSGSPNLPMEAFVVVKVK